MPRADYVQVNHGHQPRRTIPFPTKYATMACHYPASTQTLRHTFPPSYMQATGSSPRDPPRQAPQPSKMGKKVSRDRDMKINFRAAAPTLLKPDHPAPSDTHLIVTLEDLQLPPHLQRFLGANMNSTFFPTKHQYFETFHKAIARWLKRHGLYWPHIRRPSPPTSGSDASTTYIKNPDSRRDPSSNSSNFWATKWFSIIQITNFNASAFSVRRSISAAVSPRGSRLSSFDLYRAPPTLELLSNKPSQASSARNTNGASAPTSPCPTVWFTSKPKNIGRKAAPSFPTSSPITAPCSGEHPLFSTL